MTAIIIEHEHNVDLFFAPADPSEVACRPHRE